MLGTNESMQQPKAHGNKGKSRPTGVSEALLGLLPELKQELESGASVAEMSELFGVSKHVLYVFLKDNNLGSFIRNKLGIDAYLDGFQARFEEQLRNGVAAYQLAKTCGVNVASFNNFLRRNNLGHYIKEQRDLEEILKSHRSEIVTYLQTQTPKQVAVIFGICSTEFNKYLRENGLGHHIRKKNPNRSYAEVVTNAVSMFRAGQGTMSITATLNKTKGSTEPDYNALVIKSLLIKELGEFEFDRQNDLNKKHLGHKTVYKNN